MNRCELLIPNALPWNPCAKPAVTFWSCLAGAGLPLPTSQTSGREALGTDKCEELRH